ncbi:MAG: NUDIX hydrolase [Chloroflexi bacterium]|nr:NUDIX hydrolase [Chloroflexota bacterium]
MTRQPVDDRAELAALARRLGQPRMVEVDLEVGRLFDPVTRTDRLGEVAFLLQRPDSHIWLMTKEFYPPDAYRIPTGGVKLGEPIEAALARELVEETSFQVAPARFLAAIHYRVRAPEGEVFFATYLFAVPCGLERPEPQDLDERIADFRTITLDGLPQVAEYLAGLPRRESPEFGNWQDWGRFRAVVHRVAYERLEVGG